MKPNEKYGQLVDANSIQTTIEALGRNGIHAFVVDNADAAKQKVLDIIPPHSEVMTMTSETLRLIGLDATLNETERFISVRDHLLDSQLDSKEKKKMGAVHEWAVGSVHAVTREGQVVIASATGSQLASYSFGAMNIVWVVGTQKIVKNLEEAFKRIHEYSFPLEDERAKKAYGVGSGVNKILIFNKEVVAGRIHLVFVKEKLGF